MSYGDCSWDHQLRWSSWIIMIVLTAVTADIASVTLNVTTISITVISTVNNISKNDFLSGKPTLRSVRNQKNVFLLGSNGPCSSIFRPAPCPLYLFSSIPKLTFTAAWTHMDVAQGWLVTKPCKNLVTSYRGLPRSTTTSWGVGESHNDKINLNMKLPGKPWCFVIFGNVQVPAIHPDETGMQDVNPATESMPSCHELQASTFPQPLMGGSDPTRLNHAKTTKLLWIAGVSGLCKCVSPMFTSLSSASSIISIWFYMCTHDYPCVYLVSRQNVTFATFFPPFHMTWPNWSPTLDINPEVICCACCWASVFTTIEVKDHVNGHWIAKHQTQQVSHDGHLSLSFSFVNCYKYKECVLLLRL